MFKITKYNKKIDGLKNLDKLATLSYVRCKNFFGKDSMPFDIALAYTRNDFNKLLKIKESPSWVVGTARNRKVIIFSQSVFEKVSPHKKEEFEKILTHEIAHFFKDDVFGFKFPIWLSEGISGYVSEQYKKARLKKFSDFESLHTWKDWFKNSNYPQAYLFTAFLLKKYGKEKIFNLLHSLDRKGTHEAFEGKFVKSLPTTFDKVTEEWRKSTA